MPPVACLPFDIRCRMMKTEKLGVYFRSTDYANVGLRALIVLIDGMVVLAFYCSLWFATRSVDLNGDDYLILVFATMLVFLYLYLVEMKRRWGSVGNLLTKTRVIDMTGRVPSVITMLVRSGFWVMGPLMLVVDFFGITGDTSRQMIRDKLSGVYVIRSSAEPEGKGLILYSTWVLFGYMMVFREVRKEKSEPCATGNPDGAQ